MRVSLCVPVSVSVSVSVCVVAFCSQACVSRVVGSHVALCAGSVSARVFLRSTHVGRRPG
eukprot:2081081-Rhodomonas_salina.2